MLDKNEKAIEAQEIEGFILPPNQEAIDGEVVNQEQGRLPVVEEV